MTELFLCDLFEIIFFFPLLDVHCSDVKPTTQPLAVDSMRIKPTTAERITAKIETEQLTSTKKPSPTQPNSTQTPNGPDVGYLAKEKEESSLRNGRY